VDGSRNNSLQSCGSWGAALIESLAAGDEAGRLGAQ
jgi:hypothetical protein